MAGLVESLRTRGGGGGDIEPNSSTSPVPPAFDRFVPLTEGRRSVVESELVLSCWMLERFDELPPPPGLRKLLRRFPALRLGRRVEKLAWRSSLETLAPLLLLLLGPLLAKRERNLLPKVPVRCGLSTTMGREFSSGP